MIYLRRHRCPDGNERTSDRNIIRTEAHELLRSVLIQNGVPESEQEFAYNEYGKPYLKDSRGPHFNISHCSELAVCALADSPVGIDAEKIRDFPERVMKRCFTGHEIDYVKKNSTPDTAFFQLWTLKESYIKAIGMGLAYPMNKAEFIIENDNITANTDSDFSFLQIIIDNEFICSVCCNDISDNKVYYRSYEDKFSFRSLTQ